MLQGTGSDVGKSLLTAGLCRAYTRRGLEVRAFKPQNMSNNAAVTAEGGEIGRAQALQAKACRTQLRADMNPVLLKPQTDIGAQVVVQGRVWRNARARDYHELKSALLPKVLESFWRLASEADLVIAEGAGSPAEMNLRLDDIANMGFAQAASVPVVLIGDIDRGGVIASICGTCTLLEDSDRSLLKGFIINKFRGDVSLFDDGLMIIHKHTGLESFGVVPYFHPALKLPAEDAVAVEDRSKKVPVAHVRVAVPILSRIANFDDFDPLLAEPDVAVHFVRAGQALPGDTDLVILPGSKATIADLEFLRAQGWDIDIFAHLRRGGWLLGLCGGFQMLGRRIRDPEGIEGNSCDMEGLGLLDIETEISGEKSLIERKGRAISSGEVVWGFEMHVGKTCGNGLARPMLYLNEVAHGAVSHDGKVLGCYLHGLFAADGYRHAFLDEIRQRQHSGIAYEAQIEQTLDDLAAHLEEHVDLGRLLQVARTPMGESTVRQRLTARRS